MIAKLYSALAVFSIATMLAMGGFCAFLFGSGRVDAQRVDTIAAVLRGELDEPEEGAPEQQLAAGGDQEPGARGQSAEEVRAARRRDHLRSQMAERTLRDVEARQRLLDQCLQNLIEKEEQVTQRQEDWTQQQQKLTAEVQDVGFERELEYVAGLPPKQAKEHIIYLWNKHKPDATRLFMRLDVSKGKRILKEFASPEESRIRSELLEQLRVQGLEGDATESGMTDGAATP